MPDDKNEPPPEERTEAEERKNFDNSPKTNPGHYLPSPPARPTDPPNPPKK